MSTLAGHRRITAQALRELQRAHPDDPLFRGLADASIPRHVAARDVLDVLRLGHWTDSGQKHHFMRRFDGQSPHEALEEAAGWVRSRARSAAARLALRIAARGVTRRAAAGAIGGGWQDLGDALHATQDSFARGHVEREPPRGGRPGAIVHVRVYAGGDREGHEGFDELWWDHDRQDFSADGRLAVEASKELITMVVAAALRSCGRPLPDLAGWDAFRRRWFRASDGLSRRRDASVGFLRRFR